MSNYSEKIAILTGDPNGIGAEITIKALNMFIFSSLLIIEIEFILNNCVDCDSFDEHIHWTWVLE